MYLQVSLGLGLLHDGVELGGLHDVALDLELAGHEQTLGVGRAIDELAKVFLGEEQGDFYNESASIRSSLLLY